MIIDKVKVQALDLAGELTIQRLTIGGKYLGVQLCDGRCGICFRFNPDTFAFGRPEMPADFTGMMAADIIPWAGDMHSLVRSAIGISVINALTPWAEMESREGKDSTEAAGIKPGDIVGMVGFFPPLVKKLEARGDIELRVFERGLKEPHPCLYPDWAEYRLLPECDVVIMTGTSGINSTLDPMLSWCTGAREVNITGPSTMMYPSAYEGTRATVLAGSKWVPEKMDEMFNAISTNSCGNEILRFLDKITYRL